MKSRSNPPIQAAQALYIAADTLKGRGSAWAMAHRFQGEQREQFDDGWGSLAQSFDPEALPPATQIIEECAQRILSSNQSPDIPFDQSINPYRGCEHGCIYCFARPTHSYLNLSPGLDFETRIIAKVNAAERLRAAFDKPTYVPRLTCLGTATDAYQPVERTLGLTRALIEVLQEHRHPFSVLTKSSGIERDLDLLQPMAEQRLVSCYISITTLDPALARILEPRAASPQRRLRTLKSLASAGVPVGVSVSPLIPFLNEPELERILEAAAEAGARSAFCIPLRLPWEVNPLFQDWLQRHVPERAARIMARVREMRGGNDNDARFGSRMRGEGIWAELLSQRLHKACARLGLSRERQPLDLSLFCRPAGRAAADGSTTEPEQGSLF
ncbi:PA0069 family radical SAM protein [Paucibacter sp. DJ2R-2]|uniref:PA0069 family radical SAM protein n=1 Tax=Paucibacter sp. DJ2R-2 TaxID=2893558 RepID=UPI002AA430CC|nr:PA0069 family radical SAM protein [Paucibacter sp. DJ4R-1]MCV2440421.1 PA0069 family radical SAM protein [Paucibacter sp. DJ2R-2]